MGKLVAKKSSWLVLVMAWQAGAGSLWSEQPRTLPLGDGKTRPTNEQLSASAAQLREKARELRESKVGGWVDTSARAYEDLARRMEAMKSTGRGGKHEVWIPDYSKWFGKSGGSGSGIAGTGAIGAGEIGRQMERAMSEAEDKIREINANAALQMERDSARIQRDATNAAARVSRAMNDALARLDALDRAERGEGRSSGGSPKPGGIKRPPVKAPPSDLADIQKYLGAGSIFHTPEALQEMQTQLEQVLRQSLEGPARMQPGHAESFEAGRASYDLPGGGFEFGNGRSAPVSAAGNPLEGGRAAGFSSSIATDDSGTRVTINDGDSSKQKPVAWRSPLEQSVSSTFSSQKLARLGYASAEELARDYEISKMVYEHWMTLERDLNRVKLELDRLEKVNGELEAMNAEGLPTYGKIGSGMMMVSGALDAVVDVLAADLKVLAKGVELGDDVLFAGLKNMLGFTEGLISRGVDGNLTATGVGKDLSLRASQQFGGVSGKRFREMWMVTEKADKRDYIGLGGDFLKVAPGVGGFEKVVKGAKAYSEASKFPSYLEDFQASNRARMGELRLKQAELEAIKKRGEGKDLQEALKTKLKIEDAFNKWE